MDIIYIPERCPDETLCRSGGCTQFKSEKKYICAYPFYPEQVEIIKKWNETIKSIPQIDEYTLQGIDCWHIFNFVMQPSYGISDRDKYKKEARKLLDAGFNLGFNTDRGVGTINQSNAHSARYDIELWVYQCKSEPLGNALLDEVLDWIWEFTQCE